MVNKDGVRVTGIVLVLRGTAVQYFLKGVADRRRYVVGSGTVNGAVPPRELVASIMEQEGLVDVLEPTV